MSTGDEPDAEEREPPLAAPELAGEAGWTPLDSLGWRRHEGAGRIDPRSFVRDDGSSDRLRVRYFVRDEDKALRGKIWFGPATQGPPGHAHGGSMAAVLDDAMGVAAWVAGHMVVAAKIEIRFVSMLPLGTVALLEASVAEAEGRKVRTKAELRDDAGTVFATGEGLFIHLGAERFRDFFAKASKG